MATSLDQGTVNSFLRGLRYPVTRDDLIHEAQVNHVPNELLDAMRELPPGDIVSQEQVVEMLRAQGYRIS